MIVSVLVAAAVWYIHTKQGYTFAIDLNGINVCWLIRVGMTLGSLKLEESKTEESPKPYVLRFVLWIVNQLCVY